MVRFEAAISVRIEVNSGCSRLNWITSAAERLPAHDVAGVFPFTA